jgi:cation diffusion facilitator CzcD-associated flavoprotein CzcO
VTVFERSSIAGGVWHYDERAPEDPPYPNNTPSHGDYRVSLPGEFAYATPPPEHQANVDAGTGIRGAKNVSDLEVHFSPPGPCYAGLKNNVPTYLMASVLDPWPQGTEAFVSQKYLEQYIQLLAKNHGVDAVTSFHTRVDEIRKTPDGTKWEIRSVALQRGDDSARLTENISHFDFVAVASGHYNMPRVPDTEGLKGWKARYPHRITHSKQYRSPEKYRGQNVLIIGAGVSALDICRELDGLANKTYQSVRGGKFDLSVSLLPENVTRVPEVAKFVFHDSGQSHRHLQETEPIPGEIVLRDGQVLKDIHHVVLATGYITSYPFLPQLHSDESPITEAGEHLLVTSDGRMAHNLHRDIFYIHDPTLAFVGVPYYVATFSLFDFQAQAVARVFAGKAHLPTREEMRREYEKRVEAKGLGREFHSLHGPGLEVAYVQELVDWMNSDGAETGEPPMLPHSEEWKRGHGELKAKTAGLFKMPGNGKESEE